MAHVFIVNENTLKIHMNYLFAGTGAKDYNCDFLLNSTKIHQTVERLLTGMIADISRIRVSDKVLFYLQATSQNEGTFFGAFEVCDKPFIANDNYLSDKLGKNLTFRVFLKPYKVFKYGITERECLDYLDGINHPYEMCWSLIYRKLKANRGCTMITDYEFDFIMKKLMKRNSNNTLNSNYFSYDYKTNSLIETSSSSKYEGQIDSLSVTNKLIEKINNKKAFEILLQSYILQNLENIKDLSQNKKITWIGNEVSCGVGMQSIDILFIQEDKDNIYLNVCELKDENCYSSIYYQINKYIKWLKDYILPLYSKNVIIKPLIICKDSIKTINEFKIIYEKIKSDYINDSNVENIDLITFRLDDKKLIFNRRNKKEVNF